MRLSAAAILLLVSGCGAAADPPVCSTSSVEHTVELAPGDRLDLLFVIDSSASMVDEQASIAEQVPRIVAIVASGDTNPDDGIEPMRDYGGFAGGVQVGVVTTDMGTGGHEVSFADMGAGEPLACPEPLRGADGILRADADASIPGCAATYPSFLSFVPGSESDPASFAHDVGCVARVGTRGCAFEQPLEAVLEALTPSEAAGGGGGHGDGANAGFLRPDSLLLVVLVTDEDDCSAVDPELFNPTSETYPGELDLRCFDHPSALQPIERYVDGLLALRDRPEHLTFAAIVGVPPEAVADPDTINYDTVLAHPDMQERIDPEASTRLRPSCNVPGRGSASPARRIVALAQSLEARGAHTIVQSICQDDFTPVLGAITETLIDRSPLFCLTPASIRDAEGLVRCEVTETLPSSGSFTTCDSVPGRELVEVDEPTGRQICRVTQLPVVAGTIPTGSGWYYDDFSARVLDQCGSDGQGIAYTSGAAPKGGTTVRHECAWRCATTADCSAAGLMGWACGSDGFCHAPGCD